MNKRVQIITLFVLTLTVIFSVMTFQKRNANRQPVDVFLFAGQSNMLGYGQIHDIPKQISALPDNVHIWDISSQKFIRLQNVISPNFGPEIGFALGVTSAYNSENIFLIKTAVDNTSLDFDWNPENGKVYSYFQYQSRQAFKAMRKQGLEPNVRAMFWMQGERDAKMMKTVTGQPITAVRYENNLQKFIEKIRTSFGSETFFIMGKIHKTLEQSIPMKGVDFRGTPVVRQAQEKIAGNMPGVEIIETDSLSLLPDKIHHDSAGQLALGNKFSDVWIQNKNIP